MAHPIDPAMRIISSCESLQRFRKDMRVQAQLGEAGRYRRELLESGVTIAEAARRWRLEQAQKAEHVAPAQ
ncbi:MAG: hypothetical protein JO133_14440 [Burkholderiaceae bacterium]|nr:hypothetical protein [Burkholderiaceae bacterium]